MYWAPTDNIILKIHYFKEVNMNKCEECGKLIASGETICNDCKVRSVKKQKVYAIEGELLQRLQAGQIFYLYETIYLTVGSVLMEQKIGDDLDISTIKKLGLDGWEVIQVIPKTIGVALTNHVVGFSGGQSWGGGIGGNIAGVYVILKKAFRNADDINHWGKLDNYIFNHIDEFSNL
jgi:hypothetical protein